MSPILVLLRKSALKFRRARAAIAITFLVPIGLIYILGHVFGLYRRDNGGPSDIPIAVVNECSDPAAQRIVDALKSEKTFAVRTRFQTHGKTVALTEAEARRALHDNEYRYVLLLPPDLIRDDQVGLHLKFLTNPRNEIEAQTVTGMLQKTIFGKLPQLLGQSLERNAHRLLGDGRFDTFNRSLAHTITSHFGGDEAGLQQKIESGDFFGATDTSASTQMGDSYVQASTVASSDLFDRVLHFETEQVAGKQASNPMAARLVGGYAIMFLLFAVSAGATSMFEEKASGIYQRLLSSPVRPSQIVWARFAFGLLLGFVQIVALFLAGNVFFGLDVFHHAAGLVVITLAAAAACSSFGVLIAALAPSGEAARGLSTFVVITMSAIGGAWFPVSFMPLYIQAISKFTIVYWSIEGLTDVLWAGRSVVEILLKAGILVAISAVVMMLSVWRFNRNRFFE
jgi:ABC-2 type transport system permease protein